MGGLKKAGIKVNTYTVNNVVDMKKVIEVGVNSIITGDSHHCVWYNISVNNEEK